MNPLEGPTYPWESIGVNFIGLLPESEDRNNSYNSIAVVIDLLTAMVHLVPCQTEYTAVEFAELIVDAVYRYHRLPRNLISDHDVLFTSRFWNALNKLLGIKLWMSSTYHPETDGTTEHANWTITQMICQCVAADQKDWVLKLPGIEFAINSARSESTGYSPFFSNTSCNPRAMIWNSPSDSTYPGV